MKNLLLTAALCAFTFMAKSQDASVENSTSGIQVGYLGVWVHHEMKLSDEIALRGEVGLNAGFWGGSLHPKNSYALTPVITVEPRWYYNLNKRASKSKNIAGNSGNFLTVQASYSPNWFAISNNEDAAAVNHFSIIPSWGVKRNIGKHFNYEAGLGFGYRYVFWNNTGRVDNRGELAMNLHLRIGYRF